MVLAVSTGQECIRSPAKQDALVEYIDIVYSVFNSGECDRSTFYSFTMETDYTTVLLATPPPRCLVFLPC